MHINNPFIQIAFTSVSGDKFEVQSANFGGDVLSVTIKKMLSTPVGTFTIKLIGRNNYAELFNLPQTNVSPYQIFKASGMVDIYINGKEKMLGMIDKIQKSVAVMPDGKPSRIWTITGRDLGAILIDHKIYYDDTVNTNRVFTNKATSAGLSAFGVMTGLTTSELIMKIVNTWLVGVENNVDSSQNIVPFTFSDGLKIQDRFVCLTPNNSSYAVRLGAEGGTLVTTLTGQGAISTESYTDKLAIQFNMMSNNSDIYNYIKRVVNPPFNELFFDTGDCTVQLTSNTEKVLDKGKGYVIFRPTPFDMKIITANDNEVTESSIVSLLDFYNDLPFNIIDDSMIKSKELEQGRNMKPSMYTVLPTGGFITASQAKMLVKPKYDDTALRRYGYNPLEFLLNSIDFSKNNSTDKGTLIDLCIAFQNKVHSWYKYNDQFLLGSFSFYGRSEMRIGQGLFYTKDSNSSIEDSYQEGAYYITDLTDIWNFGENYITTAQVDRGISKEEFGIWMDPINTVPLTENVYGL